MTPAENRLTIRGLPLCYHTFGERETEPLLFLHGFMDSGRSFDSVVEHLSRPYFSVALDMRGHGRSGWVGPGGYYHFYDYFHDVCALIDALKFERLSIVGHSMGGSIACGVSAMLGARVSSLILLEGAGPPFHKPEDALDRLKTWSTAMQRREFSADPKARAANRKPMKSVHEAAERMRRINERLTEARALELACHNTEPAAQSSGDESGEVVWRYDPLHRTPSPKLVLMNEYAALWRALNLPVLSMYGAHSPAMWEDLKERHGYFPNVRAVRVDGVGHNIHHEKPALVARAIDRWVGEQETELPGLF